MKFENVKVGDTVFIEESINYRIYRSKKFFIPKKVVRVTKTQFVLVNGDKYKKDGLNVGGKVRAYHEGVNNNGYGTSRYFTVSDQTKEMQEFKLKLNLEHKISNLLSIMKIKQNSKFEISELEEILKTLKGLKL